MEAKEASKLLQFPAQSPEEVLLVVETLNPLQIAWIVSNWQQDQLVPMPMGQSVIAYYKQKATDTKQHLMFPKVYSYQIRRFG